MNTTLLFIDDETLMRNAFVSYFEDLGYKILTARDGYEGLDLFNLHAPDVVLLDLKMPGMGGLTVLETINSTAQNTPVIVVSGVGQLNDVIQALKLGAWDFITKPVFDMHLIELAIHRSLERVTLLRENHHYREKLEQEIQQKTLQLAKELEEKKQAEAENRALQEQLIQSQKMESIGRLAGGVAHDFNNTLTAIIGFSELALMELPKEHPAYNYIEMIKESGEKAADITRQLLAFSRKQVLTLKPLSLGHVIQRMLRILKHALGENILLQLNIAEGPQTILADNTQIEQIIMNLVLNARDAMPEGGRLILSSEKVHVTADKRTLQQGAPPGEYIVLTVQDSGEGMEKEIQEHVFEPFFTTKDPGRGTGLGLSTVFGIVKQHSGYIVIESAPKQGSVFSIYFPSHREGEPAIVSNRTESLSLPRGNETILVVDDEPAIRQFLSRALEPLGYSIHVAKSGLEALAIAKELNFNIDLLLTDIKMSGMNGYELVGCLRHECAHLRVLYMSGYAENKLPPHKDMGAIFVQKPLHTALLATKLREILGPVSHTMQRTS